MSATATITPDAVTEQTLPELRQDLDFHAGARTASGAPTWVIYDPARHKYFNIGRIEYELLKRWGGQTPSELAQRVSAESSVKAGVVNVEELLAFLKQNQLLRITTEEAVKDLGAQARRMSDAKKRWVRISVRLLFIRVPLFRPDRFLDATLPWVLPLVTPAFRWLMLFCGVLGIYLASRQWDTFLGTFPDFFSFEGIMIFVLAMAFSKVAHELAHAYTAKYYGLHVPTIGVMFIVLVPVMLYTDGTNAWKLTSRRQRAWIDSAGVLMELGLAIFATLLWSFLPDGPLRSAVFVIAAVNWLTTVFIKSMVTLGALSLATDSVVEETNQSPHVAPPSSEARMRISTVASSPHRPGLRRLQAAPMFTPIRK